MNNIKSKILTYKYLKVAFSIIVLIGIACFLLFSSSVNENCVRNGLISLIFMIFGAVSIKFCDFQIYVLRKELKSLKTKKQGSGKNKIIEFDKIA